MNHGPLIFLGVLASFITSWWALIFAPQLQIGAQQAVQTDNGLYPVQRPGLAQQGREVYVAAGCVQCHGQQIRQDGYSFDVTLTAAGSNATEVAKLIHVIAPAMGSKVAEIITLATEKSPQSILAGVSQKEAAQAQAKLTEAGASAQAVFFPLGPDIKRRWGTRRTVAADYLFDYPVQIGNSRLGPDLSHLGARLPMAEWHLLHLYAPRTMVQGSIMPAYQYLFETRPVGRKPSPDALKLTGAFAPPAGFEVLPKPEALQLVAYLQSLRIGPALFEAPQAPVTAAPTDSGPGAPAPASTPTP